MTKDSNPGSAKRILVVDDNLVNLKLACEVLEAEGYLVERAIDADQALAAIEAAVPDLILMDIALPGMDGLTLTRKLKGERRCDGVPIVALTAFAMKGDDDKAAEAGCDGYISKPIDTRRFPDQVAAFLEGRPDSQRPAPLTVLIVEDDATDLKLMRLILTKSGLIVRHKVSAHGVIDAILSRPPDVILLDVRLRGTDGRELARRLKEDPRTKDIPIVAVTAFPEIYTAEDLRDAGCDLCIVKPIDTRGLSRTLESVIQERLDQSSRKS